MTGVGWDHSFAGKCAAFAGRATQGCRTTGGDDGPDRPSELARGGEGADGFTRKCLFEAANAIFCRNLGGPRLRDWARAIVERTGPRQAKVALARKLAVILHAMWRSNTPFQEAAMA